MFDKIFNATKAQYIARPESAATDLVYLHPDTTVPRGAKLTVRSDETAVFFREGRAVGVLKAGAYLLDTQNIPFIGQLVNLATGGNHYIAEIYFVRTAETPVGIGLSELGSFVDLNSRNLLRLLFNARVTVSVTDGLALVTQLGGQSSSSGGMVEEIVSARLRNALKSHIAGEAQRVPIYEIVSNANSETLGAAVAARVAAEFGGFGLRFARFLDLHVELDPESMQLLRDYQKREADLTIDAKGAQVAADPGFATYNAVKGGRSIAEGLGGGLSRGFSGPVIGMGMGFGLPGGHTPGAGVGNAPRGQSPAEAMAAMPRPSGAPRPERFYVEGPAGPEGPYNARQTALWIISSGRDPGAVRIRNEADPETLWTPATSEPGIATELSKRRGAAASAGRSADSAFEMAMTQAIADRRITPDEMRLLVSLALNGRLAPSESQARQLVTDRAKLAGCTIEEAMQADAIAYAYWDGKAQQAGLNAARVAALVSTAPGGTHMVWTAALREWTDPMAVPEIAAILSSQGAPPPTPPPPPPPKAPGS